MSNSDISFDGLNAFIEKTEKLLNDLSFKDFKDSKEIIEITKLYLDEYENKSKIVFGLTSAFSYNELLNHKLRCLKTLKNECNRMSNNIFVPEVIETDLDCCLFSKKSILNNRINHILGFIINEIEFVFKKELKKVEEDYSELLDFKESSAVEKILILDELGILNFLKNITPFNTSTNSLSNVIGLMIGEKATTLQSYLNPMYSSEVDQKNNPKNSEKAIKKIKNKLTDIGYIKQK